MAANANDLFMEVGNPGTATTLSAPGYTAGGTSITVGSTSNWPTATGVIFAIDEAEVVDGVEVQIDGTYNEFEGVVSSATSVTSVDWVKGSGDRNYSAGALTRVYVPVSAERENRLAQGMNEEHKQTGAHSDITADTIVTTGNVTIGGSLTIGGSGSGGWDAGSGTITAVTANGNRSYTLTTSADNRAIISKGMRYRNTRTVAAPDECTSLNGTTQYWVKTTPNKLTFTDDFVVGAWVKLSSYPASSSAVMSRYNGTNGWVLRVDTTGQVMLIGTNAASGNFSYVQSYQSIPLNKWVHITAQLDMSTFTATATTSYVMIDGVDVPSVVARSGTNPTALVQAGDLMVGYAGAGYTYFPGKIAQAFVASAKITQANVRLLMSQGLTPALISTHSIASAYSFDGVTTDLNTTTPNDLSAGAGSPTATNADSPFGNNSTSTISTTLDYGIVQDVTASTLVVQMAEGCTVPTSGGVASFSYSTFKSPYGFPGQRGKWQLTSLYIANDNKQTIGALSTWYNINSSFNLVVPIGEWLFGYSAVARQENGGAGIAEFQVGFGTSTTTVETTSITAVYSGASVNNYWAHFAKETQLSLSAQTTYSMMMRALTGTGAVVLYANLSSASTYLIAENAYL